MGDLVRGTTLALALVAATACGGSGSRSGSGAEETGRAGAVEGAAGEAAARGGTATRSPVPDPSPPADGGGPRVVVLGDSLAAGLGLPAAEAFPARLEGLLEERGRAVDVVNAGVSGDTTAGGLARLEWLLAQDPDLLVVELGANDALRGIPARTTEENLRRIVERARAEGVPVLLLAMKVPPSYGAEYAATFEAIFPRIAEELSVPLVPFFLEGVAGEAELNQPDGIHPTAEGQRRAARNLLPHVERRLDERAASR